MKTCVLTVNKLLLERENNVGVSLMQCSPGGLTFSLLDPFLYLFYLLFGDFGQLQKHIGGLK